MLLRRTHYSNLNVFYRQLLINLSFVRVRAEEINPAVFSLLRDFCGRSSRWRSFVFFFLFRIGIGIYVKRKEEVRSAGRDFSIPF